MLQYSAGSLWLRSCWSCPILNRLPLSSLVFSLFLRVSYFALFITLTSLHPLKVLSLLFCPIFCEKEMWQTARTILSTFDTFTICRYQLGRCCASHLVRYLTEVLLQELPWSRWCYLSFYLFTLSYLVFSLRPRVSFFTLFKHYEILSLCLSPSPL